MTLPHDKGFISTTFDLHNTFAIVLIVLVSVHVLAALFHHFIRKDNILVRMLP
jgi:cytochrome b561